MEDPQNEMVGPILSTVNRSQRFKPPPPIYIPANSLSSELTAPVRSAGSSLRVISLEEGTRGALDEEEILVEGVQISGEEALMTGRRSLSRPSIARNRSYPGDGAVNIQAPMVASIHPRSSSSSGFNTANIRSSQARDSFSPFRASLDYVPPSDGSRRSLEDQGWPSGGGEVSLSPAPRRRSSRASISSLVEPFSAPAGLEGRERASSLHIGKDRPVSELLASYVTETFSERLSNEEQSSPGLRRKKSGISSENEKSNGVSRSGEEGNSSQVNEGKVSKAVSRSSEVDSSLHLKSFSITPPANASPQGSVAMPFPPEVIRKSIKRRSRSQPRLLAGSSQVNSISPAIINQEDRLLKSPASLSRFISRDAGFLSASAPGSRRASVQRLASPQDENLPTPIYGKFDHRRSVWSPDTSSLQSGSDSNSNSNSSTRSASRVREDSPQGRQVSPRKKRSRLLSPLRAYASPNFRDSSSSLSLRAQIERANAWTQAFDEDEGEHGLS